MKPIWLFKLASCQLVVPEARLLVYLDESLAVAEFQAERQPSQTAAACRLCRSCHQNTLGIQFSAFRQ